MNGTIEWQRIIRDIRLILLLHEEKNRFFATLISFECAVGE